MEKIIRDQKKKKKVLYLNSLTIKILMKKHDSFVSFLCLYMTFPSPVPLYFSFVPCVHGLQPSAEFCFVVVIPPAP